MPSFSRSSETIRVWLPSGRRLSTPHSLGNLFQPPTLLGFALQSFTPVVWSKKTFTLFFPFLRFLTKPFSLVSALQRLTPTTTSRVPFVASQRVRLGRDHGCSLELFDLLGFHFFEPSRRSSPSSCSPFVLTFSHLLRSGFDGTIGFCVPKKLTFPLTGRQPIWPFSLGLSTTSLEDPSTTDYFFISKS